MDVRRPKGHDTTVCVVTEGAVRKEKDRERRMRELGVLAWTAHAAFSLSLYLMPIPSEDRHGPPAPLSLSLHSACSWLILPGM